MGPTLRMPRTAAFGAAILACTAMPLLAQTLPPPSVDYAAKAKMPGGGNMVSRHSKGKLRVEMQAPGMPQPIVSYLDLRTRKGVTVMSQPGMPAMAVEAELDDQGGFGAAQGRGQRVGAATVAGEPCELWQIAAETKEAKGANTVGCITHDGIPLRMEATIGGRREVVYEVTELSRTPQEARLFSPPTNLKIMRLPKGLMPPGK